MARGRIITNEISRDKRVNDLQDPWSMLGFTWLISFADREGRTYGDPSLVKSMIFPRQEDITAEMVEGYIRQWAECGLIIWYEAEGDRWIWFPNFEKNQPGLRKEREHASIIPPFVPETCRMLAGSLPEQLPVKLNQIKLNQNNSAPQPSGEEPPEDERRFLIDFLSIPGWEKFPAGSKPSDAEDVIKLYQTYGLEAAHSCAKWTFEKPRMTLRKAIHAMQTALAQGWSMPPPGGNGQSPGHVPRQTVIRKGPTGEIQEFPA